VGAQVAVGGFGNGFVGKGIVGELLVGTWEGWFFFGLDGLEILSD
jgi:hypothetical protein